MDFNHAETKLLKVEMVSDILDHPVHVRNEASQLKPEIQVIRLHVFLFEIE